MKWKILPLFALLLASFASAAPQQFKYAEEHGLEAALDNAVCRAEFTVGVLESHIEHLGAEELQDHVDTIEADVEELTDLADDGDMEGFRDYIHESFNVHLREARVDALDARKGNMSHGVAQDMREDYEALQDDFQQCHYESMKSFGEAKLEGYEAALERARNMTQNLEQKGVDTEDMEDIIDDAEDRIVDPLRNSLNNAGNATQVREAIGQYCLYNGCPNGENYHFAAYLNHEKLGSIMNSLKDDAVEAGLGDEVDDVEEQLEDAYDALYGLGGNQYAIGQHDEVWGNLRGAAEGIKNILYELRSGDDE